MQKIIAVFVGQSGAGKTTFASMITDKEKHIASSDILLEEVRDQNIEPIHENIHRIGMMKIAEDPTWQAEQFLKKIKKEKDGVFIFDGPRSPSDVKYLKEKAGAIVIGFLASKNVRYKRLLIREKNLICPKSFIERCANETLDAGLHECLKQADIFVVNVGSSIKQANVQAEKLKNILVGNLLPVSREILFDSKDNNEYQLKTLESLLESFGGIILQKASIQRFLGFYFKLSEKTLEMFRLNFLPVKFFLNTQKGE